MALALSGELSDYDFDSKDIKLLAKGLDIAKKASDKFHGERHINSLVKNYKRFVKDNKNSINSDERVVTHSIVFHDSYKALTKRSTNTLGIVLEELYEGLGSALIYLDEAQKLKLDPKFVSKVTYAIKKHSIGNLLPRKSVESKILFDLDELDSFEPKRFVNVFEFLKFGFDAQMRAAASHLKLRSKLGFYFDWSMAEFDKKKNKFLEGIVNFRDKVEAAKKDFKNLDDVIQGY